MHPTRPPLAPRRGPGLALAAASCAALWAALGGAPPTPAPALAEVYRWVDEEGVTVYSGSPRPVGESTRLPAPADPDEAERQRALERSRQLIESDYDRREDRGAESAQSAEQAKARAAQAVKDSNCQVARKNLDTLEQHGLGRLKTPDGQYVFLSAAELAARKSQAQAEIKANCP